MPHQIYGRDALETATKSMAPDPIIDAMKLISPGIQGLIDHYAPNEAGPFVFRLTVNRVAGGGCVASNMVLEPFSQDDRVKR
jgi:hypothetical protein